MTSKREIIEAIKNTAEDNGGMPLGRIRLRQETGITEHHYQKYGTLGQLQTEAGYPPNQLTQGIAEDALVKQLVELCARFGRFPTQQQLRQARHEAPDLIASHNTFNRLGETKARRAAAVVGYLASNGELDDDEKAVLKICLPIAETAECDADDPEGQMDECGYVYLFRDGRAYKIGNSTDPDCRRDALQTGNPRRIVLVHRILTDDPVGIEKYWHDRFAGRRHTIDGGREWFHLTRDDVATFRARRRM